MTIMRYFILLQFVLILIFTGCQRRPPSLSSGPYEKVGVRPIEISSSSVAVEAAPRPIKPAPKKPTIVIDAGHGGEDFGTQSLSKPKYHEKNLNMATALLVKNYLQSLGYQVALTRTHDVFITLDNRALFASTHNAQLFVSVHYNSAPSKQAEGIEVYYYQKDENNPERVDASRRLAEVVLKKVIENTDAKSRGVKHGNFAVIRQTKMPAILIEGGFLTNEGEMEKIKDPAYVKQLAWGIAQGINDYWKNKERL